MPSWLLTGCKHACTDYKSTAALWHFCCPQMEAARAYFLEPTCSPQPVHSQPPAGTPESSPAAGLEPCRAPSGALQAALQAQHAQQGQQAGHQAPPPDAGEPGSASSGTRGNLMLRLANGAASAAQAAQPDAAWQAGAAGPALSSLTQPASAPLPIGGAAVGRGGLGPGLPPSARSSFDSLGSDPGAIWYWGSPGSASSDALGGSSRTSVDAPRGDGRASHDSWVDVPGPGCAAGSHGPSRLGADCRQVPPALPRPVLHVGSAPNPGGLAGAVVQAGAIVGSGWCGTTADAVTSRMPHGPVIVKRQSGTELHPFNLHSQAC